MGSEIMKPKTTSLVMFASTAIMLMLCYTLRRSSSSQAVYEPQMMFSYQNSTKKHPTSTVDMSTLSSDIDKLMQISMDEISTSSSYNAKLSHISMDDISTLSRDNDRLSQTSLYTDILTEEEALKFPPCIDAKQATEPSFSKIRIIGKSRTFRINDTVTILITLYDVYESPKTMGGDIVIARLTNPISHSAISGHVEDLGNGTYTAIFEMLFAGHSVINVDVLWTREAVTSLYRVRKKVPLCLREIVATFKNESRQETTVCHPFYQHIQNTTSGLCNFTDWNSGMSWYCGRPRDQRLNCKHWKTIHTREPMAPYTTAEFKLVNRAVNQVQITGSIKIDVKDTNNVTDLIRPKHRKPCSKYSASKLWYTHTASNGFLYKNRWYQKHCEAVPNILKCLKNRKLLLFGDSTVRQWSKDIITRFKCGQQTEQWNLKHSYRFSICKNEVLNLTAEFNPHSQPLYIGEEKRAISKKVSIKTRLDQIGRYENVIAIIHIYLHMTPCHHSVFRSRMDDIKIGVQNLLTRNKLAKVLIKGPALHNELPTVVASYNAYIYRSIMFQVFKGLRDKVYYVDYIDLTNALHVTVRHPSDKQVSMMVDMALNYVCY